MIVKIQCSQHNGMSFNTKQFMERYCDKWYRMYQSTLDKNRVIVRI